MKLFAAAIACVFFLTTANALNCRNGFNTTVLGMPVYAWNETYTCPSSSAQSCFLGEVTYSPEFMDNEEVTIVYGSCISTAYSSYLECGEILKANSSNVQQLLNLFPDAGDQLRNAITIFSKQLAMQINETLSTNNSTQLFNMLMEHLNITIPDMDNEMINGSAIFWNSLEELFMNINDSNYVTQWRLSMLMQFSQITPATEALSTSIINMLDRFGHNNLTNETLTMIKYRPGLAYTFFPNHTEDIDNLYYNMSGVIDKIEPLNMSNSDLATMLNQTLEDLAKYNISLSPEVVDALTQMAHLIESLQNIDNITMLLQTAYPMFINRTIESLAMMNITVPPEVIDFLHELPTIIMMANGSNSSMDFDFQMILNQTLMDLAERNVTLQNETLAMLKLVSELVTAIQNNDTQNATIIATQLWMQFESQYCLSNNVTQAYADAFVKQMADNGMNISAEYKPMIECIPGYLLKRYPNKTEEITNTFMLITIFYNNYTQYLEVISEQFNITLPPQLAGLDQLQTAINAADGNMTLIQIALYNYLNSSFPPTELSKLMVTILKKNGVNVTQETEMQIRIQSMQFYWQTSQNISDTGDIIFASVNADLAAGGKDIGPAIIDGFAKTHVKLPEEIIFVLNNIQPVLDTMFSNDTAAQDQALLTFLESYTEQFNSTQVDLQIAWLKLRMAIQNNNGTGVNEEIQMYIGQIYNLTLQAANVTEEQVIAKIKEAFPQLEQFVDFLSNLKPGEIAKITAEFVQWVMDPNKNITTLVTIINDAIYLVLDRTGVSLQDIVRQALQPDSCKYQICDVNLCNVVDLVENVTAVTKPVTTTTALVDLNATTPTTTTPTTTTPTTTLPSTTSGATNWMASGVSTLFLLFTSILSFRITFLN